MARKKINKEEKVIESYTKKSPPYVGEVKILNDEETKDFFEEHEIKETSDTKVTQQVSVKDSYLPGVLVKLGFFVGNAKARKHIKETGIMLNGILTHDSDAANNSEQYEIEYNGTKYFIFLV